MLSNTLQRRIEWGDCDPAGIVFNPNFFSFFDHGTTMLYEAAGLPKQEMLKLYGIAGCPLVATNAQFKAPCRFGDEVEITSSIADVRSSSFDIRHELTKDGKLCVEGFETRVWTAKDPETGKLKSSPIPADVVARFRRKSAQVSRQIVSRLPRRRRLSGKIAATMDTVFSETFAAQASGKSASGWPESPRLPGNSRFPGLSRRQPLQFNQE